MKCPRCDAKVEDTLNRCNLCGQELTVVRHLHRISNAYYNMGLEKAQVRDLSGAVIVLRKCLQYNKYHTDARNLLGLVLNEMGETVSALCEWVLCKYLQPDENEADRYIRMIQNNPTGLDLINQTIRKYNSALNAARSQNEDLAIIQLKKVVALNPKFVRAHQLLALLYLHAREYQKAYKTITKAQKIDTNNTTTLRYLKELREYREPVARERREVAPKSQKNHLENVTPVGTYREEKRSWFPFVNVLIGIFIGVLVSIFLIRPTMLQRMENTAADIAAVRDELSVKETELTSKNNEVNKLKEDITNLKKEEETNRTKQKAQIKMYENLIKGASLYIDKKKTEAAACVASYKESDFKVEEAKELYLLLTKDIILPSASPNPSVSPAPNIDTTALFESGRDKYNAGKTEEAIVDLEAVLAVEPESQDALYFMGRAYHKKGKLKKAEEYYRKVLEIDATTKRATEARGRLRELGIRESDIAAYTEATPSV